MYYAILTGERLHAFTALPFCPKVEEARSTDETGRPPGQKPPPASSRSGRGKGVGRLLIKKRNPVL